jgi:ADP-heptose:LPS heptosyltransferase
MSWQVRIKLAWIKVARIGAGLLLSGAHAILFRRVRQGLGEAAFQRVLVYRIGNIGDILVTLPALDAIRSRFPLSHITLLTSPGQPEAPGAQQVLPQGKWFDELIVYFTPDVRSLKGRLQLLRRLRKARFDLFVELPNQQSKPLQELRNMCVACLAGCRFAVGFEVSQHALFLREQALHIPQVRESERIYRSVELTLSLDSYREVLLPVSDLCRSQTSGLLLELGISEGERYVVMHPGAKRTTNQWPAVRFASVADEIIRRWGTPVILTGSASEASLVQHIAGLMREKATILCGQINLPRMAALLERSFLYVGNDTGPMHIAAAVGTPIVSIFGARDFPERWYPAGAGHSVLRRDVPCSPCFKEVCDRDLICLKRIEVDDVLSAVEQQFSRRNVLVIAEAKGV